MPPHEEPSRSVQREQGAGFVQPDTVPRGVGVAYCRIRRVIVAVRRGFAKEPILATLITAFVLLQCIHPQPWRTMPARVDWQTVMTLAGLLMLTKAVEYSGFLTWASHRLVRRIHSERGLALWLVLLAAGLSTLFTNDVALFVIVPLMLSLHALVPLPGTLERPLFCAAAALFVCFVALADAHHAGIGLALVALSLGAWRRDIVMRIDWLLLLIFVLMFVVLRSAASLPIVHRLLAGADLARPGPAYFAGALVSQFISNVPAAIMLAEFSRDWRALAFGVSVGGFGIAIGSLANLIAMRLVGSHGSWWCFHAMSLPFYALALLMGKALL
ncbi:anion permease [Mycetohabitans sp. B8]|nr:SLC13 family permease [Mycetohabitans sp. B8]MCG1041185.1 anion permease [Mycetohabitans sp. B8]